MTNVTICGETSEGGKIKPINLIFSEKLRNK